MSHNIRHFDYPENVDRRKVQAELDILAATEGWQEGVRGLVHRIRWLDADPQDNYDEAEEFILLEDRGDYDCLAVRYREPDREGQAKINAAAVYLREMRKAYQESQEEDNYPATRTSQYISCPDCGSKLSRGELAKLKRPNYCPLCKCDLRPESMVERHKARVAKAKAAVSKAEDAYRKAQKQAVKSGKVRWLVKIEYHT